MLYFFIKNILYSSSKLWITSEKKLKLSWLKKINFLYDNILGQPEVAIMLYKLIENGKACDSPQFIILHTYYDTSTATHHA